MQSFQFYTPTKIVFGSNAEDKVGELIKSYGGTKVMVLYGGGSAVKSGLLNKIETKLQEAELPYVTLGGVQPNPLLSFARKSIEFAKEHQVDFILAVGGGSVIDTAKATAHGLANPEDDIWDYCKKVKNPTKTTPFGVVLTISAAGSETSDSAVLTNEETKEKRGIASDLNRPKFALLNPENTFTLPLYQVSCGVADIMMHTLDRYFTQTTGNEVTDQIAEAVLRVAIQNGRIAMKNTHDYEAMSELMWCGSLSHNGITGLGAVTDFSPHQLGHEFSAKYNVAHGASLTAVWGSWATYVYRSGVARFARYARNVWGIQETDDEKAALLAIETTVNYFKDCLGMPTTVSALLGRTISEEELNVIADGCSFFGGRTIGGFQKLDRHDIYEIYKAANQ